ncbi:MAG TPA: hypothetical protein DDW30_02630 [Clostridiales bacterium]|nr:hypothetical protein [Clostridiales bacterium]
MKFRKLLAAGLAVCSLLTFAACKSDSSSTNLDDYRREDEVGLTTYATKNGGTLTFESIDSDSVRITAYAGPEQPHEVVIPATVPTTRDGSTTKKVTRIDSMAFYSLSNVKSVELPEGLEEIGQLAFAKCVQLETVMFPSTLKTLEVGAFHGCEALTSIDTLLADTQVAEIPDWCFWGCVSLKKLTVPARIKTLGIAAFINCSGLTEVTLAEGVETLGVQCFMNASSLETLALPSTLTNTDPMKDLAFYGADKLVAENIQASGAAAEYVKKLLAE